MKEASVTDDSVMTAEAASRFLQVSVKTLLSLARAGEITGRKVGREWRFVREDLISYVRAGGTP